MKSRLDGVIIVDSLFVSHSDRRPTAVPSAGPSAGGFVPGIKARLIFAYCLEFRHARGVSPSSPSEAVQDTLLRPGSAMANSEAGRPLLQWVAAVLFIFILLLAAFVIYMWAADV